MDGEGLGVRPFERIARRNVAPLLPAVVLSKALATVCLFWAYTVLQSTPLAVFIFTVQASSAVVFVLLQRPLSSGKKLSRAMWVRVGQYSLLVAGTSVLWTLGLTLCGALRATLLWEHCEAALLAVLSAVATLGAHSKGRGAVFFLLGILALLLFDNDHSSPPLENSMGPHRSVVAHFLYWLLSSLGVPDHKGGVVLLLLGLCLSLAQCSVGRRLAVEVGGAKRLKALSTTVVAALLLPWAAIQLLNQRQALPSGSVVMCLLATSLAQVAAYYCSSLASQKIDPLRVSRASSLASFLTALCTALLLWHWGAAEDHSLSVGVVIGALLLTASTAMLTRPSQRSHASLVGYSSSGLPLYSSQTSPASVTRWLGPMLSQIMASNDSRRIFYFLLLNLAFTFVELCYGMWTNSLGLISDGFHMLFDCSALCLGLYAALISRWKPTRLYSYGYGRVEVLSGFVNGLFLVAVACFVFAEALGRLLDPPHISTDRLLFVSVAGFLVNLIGIATFSHSHSHSHSHNTNMQGVFLHVLADTMGSVGVIISALFVEHLGWLIADPICSIFIALLILLSVLPLLRDSASTLLLSTPSHSSILTALEKLPMMDGVLSYSDAHFWQQSSEITVGTIHLQIAPSSNEQRMVAMVTNFLKEHGVSSCCVQVEKESYLCSGVGQSFVAQLCQATHPQVYVDCGPHAAQVRAV